MAINLNSRFSLLWKRLGLDRREEQRVFREVALRHSETRRAFHTLEYIGYSLQMFRHVDHLAIRADVIRFSVWMRDLVIEPLGMGPGQSAEAAARLLRSADGDILVLPVRGLILVTDHATMPQTIDEEIAADLDRTILGEAEERFSAYVRGLWAERRHSMPDPSFRRRLSEEFEALAEAPAIYWTDVFRRRYEASARRNLQRAVRRLRHLKAS